MLTYNFGTIYDVKQRLAQVDLPPDTLDMHAFTEAIAPLIRGDRTVDEVQGAFHRVSEDLQIDLLSMTRYKVIEAICDQNDFVRAISLKEEVRVDTSGEKGVNVLDWTLRIAVLLYLIWAVSTMATFFFPVGQVISIVQPIVYTAGVFTVIFLFPLWIFVMATRELYFALVQGPKSLYGTVLEAPHLIETSDRNMLKTLNRRDLRLQRRLDKRNQRYEKFVQEYKTDRVGFLQRRLKRNFLVISPILGLGMFVTIGLSQIPIPIWLLPLFCTLCVGMLPFIGVHKVEKRIKIRYLSKQTT